jgi:pyruvate formate-lyase activating enzyme-like uncharacterized protein
LVLVNKNNLKRLYCAGLDEIRFHLDLDNSILWKRIMLAEGFSWKVGVEIPCIPGKEMQTKKLIDFIKDKIDFLNINELEVADNKSSKLAELGFKTKDRLSYAIKGSEDLAVRLLQYCAKTTRLNVHYCTAKLKDKVQLSKRIKLRSKNAAMPYDIVDEEGILFRGAIYSKNLNQTFQKIRRQFKIPSDFIEIDDKNKRILTASWIIEELKVDFKRLGLKIALVEEYPTWDQLEISKVFL